METTTANARGSRADSVGMWGSVWNGLKWLSGSAAVVAVVLVGWALVAANWTWEHLLKPAGLRAWSVVSWVFGEMKRTLALLTTAALAAFWLSFSSEGLYPYSSFSAGTVAAVAGCTLFYVICRFGHRKLDIINQLIGGNNAIAYHLRSYAIIIAAGIVGALVAGFIGR